MLNLKSIAKALLVIALGPTASLSLAAGCGGSQSPSAATDASGQPEDMEPMPESGSSKSKDSGKDSTDNSVGDVTVSSAFDANGEPIPGADGDISPDAKRPPKPPPDASASATPATAPPKGKPSTKK